MSLKTKLFCFLVLIPVLLIGYYLSLISSTFVTTQTAGVFENQIQLLNSVHLLLSRIDSRNMAQSTKNLFIQEGLHSLIIADPSGKIRYAGEALNLGKVINEVLGENILKNIQNQTSEQGSFEAAGAKGENLLVSFFKLELGDHRYFMLLTKPKSTATRAVLFFTFKSVAILAALFAVFFITNRLTYDGLVKGVEQLAKAMEGLGKGNWLSPVPAQSASEVGVLAKSFNSMRKQLHIQLQEEKKKARIEVHADFSVSLRNMFLPAAELKFESLQFAAALETKPTGGTFWHHYQKTTEQGSYFLFLLAEAPRGEALASLSAICRWSLERDPTLTDPQQCAQSLNSLIASTFGKNVSWNYCLCSVHLETGELKWVSLSYTTPNPFLLNATKKESQVGSEGQLTLSNGDFIILHSTSTKPNLTPQTTLDKLSAKDLLALLQPKALSEEEKEIKKEKITANQSVDQTYVVVKWGKT